MWAWLPLRPADSREKRDYSQSASPPPVAQRGARTAETPIPDRRRVQARRQSHGEGDENRPGSSSDERHAAFVERDIIISLSLSFFSFFQEKKGKSTTSLRDGTRARHPRHSKNWSWEAALLLRTRSGLTVYFSQCLFFHYYDLKKKKRISCIVARAKVRIFRVPALHRMCRPESSCSCADSND